MTRLEVHNEADRDASGRRAFSPNGFIRFLIFTVIFLMGISTPSVLTDVSVYGYADPASLVKLTNISVDERLTAVHRRVRYHPGVSDLELEQAVIHAAQLYHVQPALLLAVIKAESSFNPTAVSKAGAVGLMQLIPETAIRHGVHNLYDANENITGGAKHLRYLLNRFHGNIRLALAAYNAGERKVDRYGQIPPYKETQDYVKKVLAYYRSYKKEGWIMPVAITAPSVNVGRPY